MSVPAIHAASWLLNPDAPPISGGALLVRDGIVAKTGTLTELKNICPDAPVTEYPGCAIIPGFVNAHTHLELTHYPAWRSRAGFDHHPSTFVDWILELIKTRRTIAQEAIPASIGEGVRMCLESGTTAVGEIVTNPGSAQVYRTSGIAGRLYFELVGHDDSRFRGMLEKALAACEAETGRLFNGLSPHTPYTIAENHLPAVLEASTSRNLPMAIHISESRSETDFIFDTLGPTADKLYPIVQWQPYLMPPRRCSSTELLDRAGLISTRTLAVHCVHVSIRDAETLKRRGASIALCPRSNERLDVGVAPVHLFKKMGIRLAIGTDSLASNDTLSLWDEMRFALNRFPRDLSPADLFRMATRDGADALSLGMHCGALEPGRRADFQIVSEVGGDAEKLTERLVCEGRVEDVYVEGERYAGA